MLRLEAITDRVLDGRACSRIGVALVDGFLPAPAHDGVESAPEERSTGNKPTES